MQMLSIGWLTLKVCKTTGFSSSMRNSTIKPMRFTASQSVLAKRSRRTWDNARLKPSGRRWKEKTPDQKRMDHVWRLLSYAVTRVMEADEDGLVPFLHVLGEPPLLDRVHAELGSCPRRDVNEVEVELVNELKRKVKGYDRAESIRQWLELFLLRIPCLDVQKPPDLLAHLQ